MNLHKEKTALICSGRLPRNTNKLGIGTRNAYSYYNTKFLENQYYSTQLKKNTDKLFIHNIITR